MPTRRHFFTSLSGGLIGLSSPSILRSQSSKLIAMVTYQGHTEAERGFQDYLRSHGLMAEFVSYDLYGDMAALPAALRQIRQIKPDLIYTLGSQITLGVVGAWDDTDRARHITDIPVVFSLVGAPLRAKIVQDFSGSGRNVTGAVHVVPLPVQMQAMRSYRDFDRIGFIYAQADPNSYAVMQELSQWASDAGKILIAKSFDPTDLEMLNNGGITDLVAQLAQQGANWLYYPPDTYLTQYYQQMSLAALALKLPTFGSIELAIREGGALAGLVCSYYAVGQLVGRKAFDILTQPADPGTIAIETLNRFSLIINMPVARELEFYPPLSMLDYAEVI